MTSRSSLIAPTLVLGLGLLAVASPRDAAAQPAAPAPERMTPAPRVAVIVQLAVNVDERRVDALAATLAESLGQALVVDAIGGADVTRRLPMGDLPEECITTPECVRDIGQRLDAEQLLIAVLVQVGDDLQIDVTWVDVATSRTVARPSIALAADAHAGKVFAEAAIRLLPDAAVRSTTGNGQPDDDDDDGTGIGTGPGPTPVTPTSGRRMTKPAWITAGVGAAALISGVAFGLSARSLYHECDAAEHGCSDDKLDSLDTRTLVADVSFGIAAGAAIATGVLFLMSGGEEEAGPAPVDVRASGGGVTILLGGRF